MEMWAFLQNLRDLGKLFYEKLAILNLIVFCFFFNGLKLTKTTFLKF